MILKTFYMLPPTEIQPLIQEAFVDQKAYGQIATTAQDKTPTIRTVHLHWMENQILINTNIQSEKWVHLQNNPFLSGCFWWEKNRVQIRFTASVKLLCQNEEVLTTLWNEMRPQVRLAYHLNDQNIPMYQKEVSSTPTQRSPNHGVIACSVHRWDIFHDNPAEYRLGKRVIFQLDKENTWIKKEVSSLHEKPIVLYD